MKDYFAVKSIRDPLYGFIHISQIERQIIDSEMFRRLLNIKQLSHAYIAYPSAIHTRFEHSLGVMYLAGRICDKFKLEKKYKEIIRLAALLHDIGHGPYSHLFESFLEDVNGEEIDHEWISKLMISKDPELQKILGDKAEKIIQVLSDKQVTGWDRNISKLAKEIISNNNIDVDRMDYLRRDSYHIGVEYGRFDLARILHTIDYTKDYVEWQICIHEKGKDAVENYRIGRYLMHRQVYQHHARLIADQMFLRALYIAKEEGILPIEKLLINTASYDNNDEFLNYYKTLDDKTIYDEIIVKHTNSIAARILKNIQKRNLLKRVIDIIPDYDIKDEIVQKKLIDMKFLNFIKNDKEIADKFGLEFSEIISFTSKVSAELYSDEILILKNGVPQSLDNFSLINAKKLEEKRFFVLANKDENIKSKVYDYVKDKFKIINTNYEF